MEDVALNFFPLENNDFYNTLYCIPYTAGERPVRGDEVAVSRFVEIDGQSSQYWTFFNYVNNSTEVKCKSYENVYASIDALRISLIKSCMKNLDKNEYRVIERFHRRIELITCRFQEGVQVVALEPYLLRSQGKFGFLVDFRFHPNDDHRGTRRSQQLSLSLDKHGQPNLNYYADRYTHLVSYVQKYHDRVFPIETPNGYKLDIEDNLLNLRPDTLDLKTYIVGPNIESRSQFMGMKKSGPLKKITEDTHLYFLYRQEDHGLSQDLFRALRGDTFSTFSGMEKMFHFPLSKDNVSGVVVPEFKALEIESVCERVHSHSKGRNVVPIVLTPFSRNDSPSDNAAYWKLKHTFLAKGLPIQVVATETIADRNKLKWSTASIGLQVFAKAGGTPWKVRPRTEKCLIVGIGQAHRKVDHHIDRYFAYSVLSDSSGVFEEVRILGEDQEEEGYLKSFSANLKKIFEDYSSRFSNFVVHATFAIRKRELDCIASTLKQHKERFETGEFVSLKFNEKNRFFGFSVDHNSRVPYESTVLTLSRSEFLVWFEGLQFGHRSLQKMVGNPLHVKFTYPDEGLSLHQKQAHLQDAINLSGANWRGFNAKSLPVSVYYAQLIAQYIKEFENHELGELKVDILKPWFL